MLLLKEANLEDIDAEYAYITELPADENGFTNRLHGISREAFTRDALPDMLGYAKGVNLPCGHVPCTEYFLWENGEIIGCFRLRHYLNEGLRAGAGHIGYGIRKDMRGRGYAKRGLALLLEQAKQIVPEDEIYLSADNDNPASLRVMLACGGYVHHRDDAQTYVRIPKAAI